MPLSASPVTFETHPDRYQHWKLAVGTFANYIAPPRRGINQKPVDFDYVRTEQ
jgi:hypothetical protein